MPINPITVDDKLTLTFYLFIRQMGSIADCLRHIQGDKQGAGYDEREQRAWIAYLETELADTLMMVRKVCRVLKLDYKKLEELGILRDEEKAKEYLKRHPEAIWV